jgi:UDP-N-acetylenolpyruvoylglucosamine reductase
MNKMHVKKGDSVTVISGDSKGKTGKVRGGKVGAGYLVEKLGLKGKKLGGAKVSEKHANFIVNSENAKAEEVYALAQEVKKQVFSAFNIDFEEEVQLLGF